MYIRNLLGVLAVLLVCGLLLGVNSCSSVSDDVLGTDTLGSGATSDENDPDDEGTDEDEDGDEGPDVGDCPGVGDETQVDSIEVMPGDTCTLYGTIVVNDIVVGRGATLEAHGIAVGGNIISDSGATSVVVDEASGIRGNIELSHAGESTIDSSTIAGNIFLDRNLGLITVSNNEVLGGVKVLDNTGGVYVISNQITDTLDCSGNDPVPRGQGNTASAMLGQCQGF